MVERTAKMLYPIFKELLVKIKTIESTRSKQSADSDKDTDDEEARKNFGTSSKKPAV